MSPLPKSARVLRAASVAAIVAAIVLFVYQCSPANSRDTGQWADIDAAIGMWFFLLKQPDNPFVSCCGEADAYWADSFKVKGNQYIAIITDERPDRPLNRIPRAVGTEILVPNHKMKFDGGNPTGHGVIFVGGSGEVLCYVAPGGG